MSKNVVDAVIDVVNNTNLKIGFIPSRRQVEYDGGYVNNWTTKSFTEYVKSKNHSIFIERDHGGPGQGYQDDDGSISFETDVDYFDIIHIDPWKKFQDYEDGLRETVNSINSLFSINPNCFYEIGTEESIRFFSESELEKLIVDLKKHEIFILWFLAIPIILFGFYPEPLIATIEVSVNNLIEIYNLNLENNLQNN